MITKGYVIKKAKAPNKFVVRLPIFENAGVEQTAMTSSFFEAALCYNPGTYEGIQPGDCVFVAFEGGGHDKPIILGKLYTAEKNPESFSYLSSLEVVGKAELPENTTIGNYSMSSVLRNIGNISVGDFVTKGTQQTITGRKTFTQRPVVDLTVGLPAAYQQVEYIKSEGQQWIDTGYKITSQHIIVEFKCDFSETSSLNGLSLCGSNGSYYDLVPYHSDGYGSGVFQHWVGTSGGIFQLTYNTTSPNIVKYELDNGTISCELNGVSSSNSYNGSIISNYNFFIFGKNGYGNSAERAYGYKLYYFRIIDDNNLVRDFIPCYKKANNEAGLYDLVSGTFYSNQGSGDFIAGPAVSSSQVAILSDLDSVVNPILQSIGQLSTGTGLLKLTNGVASLDSTSYATGSVVTTSGSQSVTINGSTLSFGANAFNSTTIPSVSLTTTTGSEKVTVNSTDLTVVTRDTAQTITGAKNFTGVVEVSPSEAGVQLGIDNGSLPNANISIVSANNAAYIDMGTPNVDYGFRIIKWKDTQAPYYGCAQLVYGHGGSVAVPDLGSGNSDVLAVLGDVPKIYTNSAKTTSTKTLTVYTDNNTLYISTT